MNSNTPIAVFWFRRDLRLNDNAGLYHALTSGLKVLPVFIFDPKILHQLNTDDKRVSFIWQAIEHINRQLTPYNAAVQLFYGDATEVFGKLMPRYTIHSVFANHDYEPEALVRDKDVAVMLNKKGVSFHTFKDQVVFEKDDIAKANGEPYTVFTPYSRKWKEKINQETGSLSHYNSEGNLAALLNTEPNPGKSISLGEIGFTEASGLFKPFQINSTVLETYDKTRDIPALDTTSRVGVHLRFGTVSVREMVAAALKINPVWLNELIWREFFMQILWHFPHVVQQPFKPKYQFIEWINNEDNFKAWCQGQTGYPLVDAGMRELNETGFMHNRVRMVTASFLVKHLLVNWQWGEAWFAQKLLDFELSSNNGNWQWAAGTGCDAAPYFRIFNPTSQAEKFDPGNKYIKKWVPESGSNTYHHPLIEHSFARERCLRTYKAALQAGFNNI